MLDGQPSDMPILAVEGAATAGKTSVLESLDERLAAGGVAPVRVGAPPRAPDAAPLVLMQLAERLKAHGFVGDADVGELADPERPWFDKVESVREWLVGVSDRVVLLCDEPRAWVDHRQPEFADHVENVWERIVFDGVGCPLVITGRAPRGTRGVEAIELVPCSGADAVVAKLDKLQRPARKLQERLGELLEPLSPLELRLLVALLEVDGIDAASSWFAGTPQARTQLSARLFERLAVKQDDWQALYDIWVLLACVRKPFERSLLDASGLLEPLSSLEDAVLFEALLFQRGDRLELHEALRARALSQLGAGRLRPLHEKLADYFAGLGADQQRPDRRLDSMEAFDHASRTDAYDLERYPPFFVDQLNVLGYRLSRDGRRKEAAEIFERALLADPDNDYSNHYRAFNLDLLGARPQEVEMRYRKAVFTNDRHPWWHSRLVSFLVIRGRMDAAREALDTALLSLFGADGEPPARVYREFHLDIAANLVHRGQLDLAASLLDRVPAHAADQIEEYIPLRRLVASLTFVAHHDQFVPLGAPAQVERWWMEGPFAVSRDPIEAEPLARWLAGTVSAVENNQVEMFAASVRLGQLEMPVGGPLLFSVDQLETWRLADAASVLALGDFIEIGFYGSNELHVRAARHPRSYGTVTLPRVLANPNRYLVGALRAG